MAVIYSAIPNYGITVIVLSLLIKIILLPLGIKQYNSMNQMNKIKPQIERLQQKYKNDKNKLAQETMNLHKEHGINPLGGCLPLVLQLPILFALFSVISKPLTYMFSFTKTNILSFQRILGLTEASNISQMTIIDEFTNKMNNIGITGAKLIDLNFFGLNLGLRPSFNKFDILLLVPIIAGVSAFFAAKIASKMMPVPTTGSSSANSMSSPQIQVIMSVMISFSAPAGVGLYWIISNILQIIQQFMLDKLA